jgi:hypothetical protein
MTQSIVPLDAFVLSVRIAAVVAGAAVGPAAVGTVWLEAEPRLAPPCPTNTTTTSAGLPGLSRIWLQHQQWTRGRKRILNKIKKVFNHNKKVLGLLELRPKIRNEETPI